MKDLAVFFRQRQKLVLTGAQVLFWAAKAISFYHQLSLNPRRTTFWNVFDTFNAMTWQIVAVYTCTGILFHRFYLKGKYVGYWALVLGTTVLCAIMDLVSQTTANLLLKPTMTFKWLPVIITYTGHLIDCAMVVAIFIIAHMVLHYYRKDKENKLREKERIESELMFLKSQINPHFLFNALNSIYVLMKENTEQSEQTLLQFSSLLRYQLYDCSNALTQLEDEVEFIRNYLGIEQLRVGDRVQVSASLPKECGNTKIAPFIIIPFVENAFKHVSALNGTSRAIAMDMQLKGNCMELRIENTFTPGVPMVSNAKGIGLANVKRRLQLLYNNKHNLDICTGDDKYRVHLKIELDDH